MGWESRRGQGRYYTRTRRVGGTFVREYVGTGAAAEHAAEDGARRAERQADASAWRAQQARFAAADAAAGGVMKGTQALVHAHLLQGGYRRHVRGHWRRRRGA